MLSFAMLHWPLAPRLLNQLAHHGGSYTGVMHTQTYVCMHAQMHRLTEATEGQAKQCTNDALSQGYPTEGKLTIFCK